MTLQNSNNRLYTLVCLWLALCVAAPAYVTAAEVELQAYTATYSVKGRGLSLGTAEISLRPFEDMWRWRMTTEANAFVSLFTDEEPSSETTFTWNSDGLRLQNIHIGDENGDKGAETADFDWVGGKVDMVRKRKRRQAQLVDEVYDLQSVHLRAAIMQAKREDEASFQLYYKGKLHDSKLVYLGSESLWIGERKIDARVYEHSIVNSDKALKYYYEAARPLVPVLIENRKSGKSRSELRLQTVDGQP